MIDISEIIKKYNPSYFEKYPSWFETITLAAIKKIVRLNDVNRFLKNHSDKMNVNFIDELFEYLDFSFVISQKDREKIPSEGKLIVIANHPLGALDSLALIKAISVVRSDIKIVANEILLGIDNLKELLLPYNVFSFAAQKENLKAIGEVLDKEGVVIIFPAAEVSRLKMGVIKDGIWHKGVLYFSQRHQAPVLPVYIKAKNSLLFYLVSGLSRHLSTLMLPREIFNKRSKNISLVIGDQIPSKALNSLLVTSQVQVKLLKKHLYLVGKNRKGIFRTEKNIIFPVNRKKIKKELQYAKQLGLTNDGKKILLTDYLNSPEVVKEIARLRELTFRKVGEGTGRKMDIDEYDKYYKHLVLWDEEELEIVGAYRIGICKEVLNSYGTKGLYTSTLFGFSNDFVKKFLPASIELGRSFIQKKYWNTNALDYLWQGIGAFINSNPAIKYMIGPVSISNLYPDEAKRMLVYFYMKWFDNPNNLVKARNPFTISSGNLEECMTLFNSNERKDDFRILKMLMKNYGFSVPPLYKHYTELCEPGGVNFLDFGIDKDFENCIDGFIVVEVDKIKESKKSRYLNLQSV
ncbi:MAG: GNAT family N-acetyltransferase [Ignavibacteriales bacterium]|nr:MAG: GNAT family N-acetyltransferase [Ignavibacteriales bacterium]